MNRVILLGNLGSDPERKETQSGTVVTRLRIATSERRKQGEEWVEHTEWHSIIFFAKKAEAVAKFFRKGHKILVEGRLKTRQWEDKEGRKRESTEVVADDFEFVERKQGGQQQGGGGGGGDFGDDDIPY